MIKPISSFYYNPLAIKDDEVEISDFYTLCISPSSRVLISFFKFLSLVFFILLVSILGSLLFAGLFDDIEIEVVIFNLGLFLLSSMSMLFFRKFGWKPKFDYFSRNHMVMMFCLALTGIISIIVSTLNNFFLDSLYFFYSFFIFFLSIALFIFLFLADTVAIEVNPYQSELRIVQNSILPFTKGSRIYHKNHIKEFKVIKEGDTSQKIMIKINTLQHSQVIDIHVSYNQGIITALFISKHLDIPIYYHETLIPQIDLYPIAFNERNRHHFKEKFISNCTIRKMENGQVQIVKYTFNEISTRWNINSQRAWFGITILSSLIVISAILLILAEFQLAQFNLLFTAIFFSSNGLGLIILVLLYLRTEIRVDKKGIHVIERLLTITIIKEFIPLEFVSHLESKKEGKATEQNSSLVEPEYEFNLYLNCFIDSIPLLRSFQRKEGIEDVKLFLEKSVFY